MTTVDEVKALVAEDSALLAQVSAGIDALLAQVAALAAQVAAGSVASQADLDAIGAGLQGMKDVLVADVAKEPVVETPSEPVA